jgi:hypothetical protein
VERGYTNFKLFSILTRYFCLSFQNVDRKYYQWIPRKEVAVQLSKRRCHVIRQALGSYWGGTIASPFFCLKKILLYFENIISPSQRISRCRNWVTSPLAAHISCCLTRCSFVCFFMLNRPQNAYIRVINFAIVLASKDNTNGKTPNLFTQKSWIKPPWLWCLQATFF